MRFSTVSGLILFCATSAFATHANTMRANFWQLHFSQNYGGDPALPIAMVEAHVGEATFRLDNQWRPIWDSNQALVKLNRVGDHFYATYEIDHDADPEISGGYKGAIVQYHYFLKGEESQIDPAHPDRGGHWTSPVLYVDPTLNPGPSAYQISNVMRTSDPNEFETLKARARSALAADASSTSVTEVQCNFAD